MKYQEISEAYSILGDKKSRTEYDKKIDKFKTKGSYSNGRLNIQEVQK